MHVQLSNNMLHMLHTMYMYNNGNHLSIFLSPSPTPSLQCFSPSPIYPLSLSPFLPPPPSPGLFVPMQRISKAPQTRLTTDRRKKSANGGRKRESVPPQTFRAQGAMAVNTDLQVPNTHVHTHTHTRTLPPPPPPQVGERVCVGGTRNGTLRFAGPVKFAPGYIYTCIYIVCYITV